MNEEEQLEILQIISRSANDGDNVYMDVTHGFRHLPMLVLQSAFLMSSRFTTKGIYYAAFDRRTAEGYVPVISLSGAMKINNWCCAVATLKETGNVSSLARLSGMEAFREDLLKCQFFEQMNDVAQSRRHARAILDHLPDLPPEGRLFEAEIAAFAEKARQGWVIVSGFLSPGEKELGRRLRAAPRTRWVKTLAQGLPPRYDPSLADSRDLAAGRMLILSALPDGTPFDWNSCHEMNARAAAMCRRARGEM